MRRRRKHYASRKVPHNLTAALALDGVQLAILNKRLEGVCRKMANTLFRTGRSGVLNTARDFSCCIVTADNQFLASAESLPIHVLSGPDLMAAAASARRLHARPSMWPTTRSKDGLASRRRSMFMASSSAPTAVPI